ncbi:PAS domain S-box protein [Undibacterium parvum]|uniref:histidine kinase n=1 Tax=Undibacterium parvum TaxID=401471 RepID=A0A3S9HJL2_9BURK|nr:PAS domain S-box protein [Undibacterium parvum]AZP12292.1 PAS domain S-box protein [Undibacterium parvum]
MLQPGIPDNEVARLAELRSLCVLDTPSEERFERITRSAQLLFGVPIVLISLIDQDRQWFKSKQGLDASQTPRNVSFCGHAILQDPIFVVENADLDPRFADNPLVTAAPFVKFYAGVPLNGPNGYKLGTLCLIAHSPRSLSARELAALKDFAAWAETELALSYHQQRALDCESKLVNVLENVADAIITVDLNDRIQALNTATLAMFNYTEESLLGRNIKSLLTESYHSTSEGFIQNYRRVNQAKMADPRREMIGKRSDGSHFAIAISISEMQLLVEKKLCYLVIIREISELKLAEQKLQDSIQLFNTLMNSTTSYVHVRDLQGRYLYVNKEYERIFHCSNADILGKSYLDVLPLELAEKVAVSERLLIEKGLTLQTENNVQGEDGTHTYLVVRSPLFDLEGKITGTCGVGTDITDNKRLEQKTIKALASLRASEERWKFALEGSGDGVWDWDIPSGKVQLSKRWKEMLGHSEAEIGDALTEWSSRVHPEDMPAVMADVEANLDGITNSFSNEHRVLCKDGSYLWILDRGMVVQRAADGAALRMVGTHTDISQRKQMERIKSEFISTVSHELRTPVTSIRGALGLLEAGILGTLPDKALELIKVANRNSQRLITLVNDILDMDKLLSGQMTIASVSVNLKDLIAQSIEANAAYAASYQVRYRMEQTSLNGIAIGDPDRLMQVLANLLSNAAKFSPPGAEIEIRLAEAEAYWRVEVEDHGSGIPLDFQSRIFEAFAQAESDNTRQQGGTGLGLNISKKLIGKMGGEIGYVTQPGLGTCFWFTVPRP